jgi:hypothetical protein
MAKQIPERTRAEKLAHVVAGDSSREHADELDITGPGGTFRGLLFSAPRLGASLVVYRIGEGDILKTTPVRSVSTDPDGVVYVHTMNSTYRLARRAASAAVDAA